MTPTRAPSTETYARLWNEFEVFEERGADQGSGMTREQLTGAAMMLGWLNSKGHLAEARPTAPELAEALLAAYNHGVHQDAYDYEAEAAALDRAAAGPKETSR